MQYRYFFACISLAYARASAGKHKPFPSELPALVIHTQSRGTRRRPQKGQKQNSGIETHIKLIPYHLVYYLKCLRIFPEGGESKNTYNSGDSLVVTHLTTNPPVHCLYMAERTGSLVFSVLWSYVMETAILCNIPSAVAEHPSCRLVCVRQILRLRTNSGSS